MLKKNWGFNDAVRQLFMDFKKAYDSVRREVLYNDESYSVPKPLYWETFPIYN